MRTIGGFYSPTLRQPPSAQVWACAEGGTLGLRMTSTATQTSGSPDTSQPVRERVVSGVQPSGASHLGNYLGAQVNYVKLQDEYDTIYGIVDLHSLTTVHDGEEMRR